MVSHQLYYCRGTWFRRTQARNGLDFDYRLNRDFSFTSLTKVIILPAASIGAVFSSFYPERLRQARKGPAAPEGRQILAPDKTRTDGTFFPSVRRCSPRRPLFTWPFPARPH